MENEKLKISISPITIEVEAPANFFAQSKNPDGSLSAFASGLLGLFSQSTGASVGCGPETGCITAGGDCGQTTEETNKEERPAPKARRQRTVKDATTETPAVSEMTAVQEAIPTQEAASSGLPEYSLAGIRKLSAKKDDKDMSGNRGKIKGLMSELGYTSLSEMQPEHFAQMMDFLNTLEDAK